MRHRTRARPARSRSRCGWLRRSSPPRPMITRCRFRSMSTALVRPAEEFEATLRRYSSERAEEARAVRVGEKERSEAAAIVARYVDLFSREQLDALREAEDSERDTA